MKILKLLELINGLSEKEFKELERYIMLNNHMKNKYFIKTYEYFKLHRGTLNLVLDKADFSRFVYGKLIDETKIRLIISDFSILIEKYYVLNSVNSNYILYQKLLLEQYRMRGAFKNYKMLQKKLKQQFKVNSLYTIYDYYLLADIESSSIMYKDNKMDNQKQLPYLSTLQYYDHMFILAKLHFDNLNTISKSPIALNNITHSFLVDEIVLYIESNEEFFKSNHLMIYIEFLIHKMFRDYESYKYYIILMKYLTKYFNKLDKVYLTHLFYTFNTHLVNKVNISEELDDYKKFGEVLKIFQKNSFFDDYKWLPAIMFHNCVNILIKSNDTKTAELFYFTYRDKIDPEQKGDITKLTYIQILIVMKKYEAAIAEIGKIKSKNYQIYLNSRMYLLMIYFEIGYIENVLFTIDSLKHFLARHKIELGGWYDKFNLFANYLKTMVHLDKNDEFKRSNILEEMKKTKTFGGKQWLISKLSGK